MASDSEQDTHTHTQALGKCGGDCPHAVASTLMQRHRESRQRFDSADYAMNEQGENAGTACAGCTCGRCGTGDTDLEHEPEPGQTEASARQQLRCLRLQRFDSADWAMQVQRQQRTSQPDPDADASERPNVAQMLMDRHATKPCTFVGPTPVKNSAQCAEKA